MSATGSSQLSCDLSKAGKLSPRMETSPDGKSWTPMLDGSYERAD